MEEVILYTTNCPICNRLKQMLETKKIQYTTCSDEEKMLSLGIEVLPVLSVNGTLLQAKAAMDYINKHEA